MTSIRKYPLVNNQSYHIVSRSIAKYVVFNNGVEYNRIFQLIDLYRFSNFEYKYSQFANFDLAKQTAIVRQMKDENEVLIKIVAFCVMPTHLHFILEQIKDNGITKYISRILNGYAKYFNTKHKRFGPLWAGRFKNVLVSNNEQLLHLTRYIHLNPISAGSVKKPEDWQFSSYNQYTDSKNNKIQICEYDNLFDLNAREYKKFVNERKNYQRELSLIKNIIIDSYAD